MGYESTSAILHPSRHICSRSVSALASHDGSVGTKSPSAKGNSRTSLFLITVSRRFCLSSLNMRASAVNISCSKCSIRVKQCSATPIFFRARISKLKNGSSNIGLEAQSSNIAIFWYFFFGLKAQSSNIEAQISGSKLKAQISSFCKWGSKLKARSSRYFFFGLKAQISNIGLKYRISNIKYRIAKFITKSYLIFNQYF